MAVAFTKRKLKWNSCTSFSYRIFNRTKHFLILKSNSLGLLSLSHRIILNDFVFPQKLVHGNFDFAELLKKLDFYIPRQSRRPQLFGVSHHSTSCQQHSVIPHLMQTSTAAIKRNVKASACQ